LRAAVGPDRRQSFFTPAFLMLLQVRYLSAQSRCNKKNINSPKILLESRSADGFAPFTEKTLGPSPARFILA
jgi:hypothetical protein